MSSWIRPASVILVVAVTADALALELDMGPHLPLFTAAALLVATGVWLAATSSSVTNGHQYIDNELAALPHARHDRRAAQLHRGIAFRRSDDSLDRLRSDLVELIDDQLRAVHNVDRRRQPERASAVLGPELTGFVDDDDSWRLLAQPGSLDRIVTLIEHL